MFIHMCVIKLQQKKKCHATGYISWNGCNGSQKDIVLGSVQVFKLININIAHNLQDFMHSLFMYANGHCYWCGKSWYG